MATTQTIMKNLMLFTTLFLGLNFVSSAQDKTSVGIIPFTYVNGTASAEDVNSIQETVTNAFVKSRRFNIVDRSKMDALKREKDLQKSEDFIDGSVIQQGISLGANYLISGHVISALAEGIGTLPDAATGMMITTYRAKLAINLKVIDVATGEVLISETIEPKAGSTLAGLVGVAPSSPEAAITKAIRDIESKVDEFVNKNFPVTFPIIEIQEKDSRGGATKILIAGGTGHNLQKGGKLKVVELLIVDVNGKKLERRKEIGELKILKVEDENFSICSVTYGGTDINAKFESKAKILVITNQ